MQTVKRSSTGSSCSSNCIIKLNEQFQLVLHAMLLLVDTALEQKLLFISLATNLMLCLVLNCCTHSSVQWMKLWCLNCAFLFTQFSIRSLFALQCVCLCIAYKSHQLIAHFGSLKCERVSMHFIANRVDVLCALWRSNLRTWTQEKDQDSIEKWIDVVTIGLNKLCHTASCCCCCCTFIYSLFFRRFAFVSFCFNWPVSVCAIYAAFFCYHRCC